jgi:hypothetical protein
MLTDVLYALPKHHLVKYLTATKTNKAVYTVSTYTTRQRPAISRFVHLWHLAILERRDIIPSEVLIESRAGYWSCLSGLPQSVLIEFKQRTRGRHSYEAGAATVAWVLLLVGSEVIFLFDFDCGDREAVAGVVEKPCWEGRLLDRERRALPDGRSGISFVAIMQLSPCCKKLKLSSEVNGHFGSRNCCSMTLQKVRRRSALNPPRRSSSIASDNPRASSERS